MSQTKLLDLQLNNVGLYFFRTEKKKEKRLKGIQKDCDEIQHCAEENVS